MNYHHFLAFCALILFIPSSLYSEQASIEELRQELDQVGFNEEKEAQRYGAAITKLWDDLRLNPDFPSVVQDHLPEACSLHLKQKQLSKWDSSFGEIFEMSGKGQQARLSGETLSALLTALKKSGWALIESEWHHLKFQKASADDPPRSTINVTLHAQHQGQSKRLIMRGLLEVAWSRPSQASDEEKIQWKHVDASGLRMWQRSGELPFKIAKDFRARELHRFNTENLHPVLVEDLDDDGLPEITLAGANLVLRNRGELAFKSGDLFSYAESLSSAAAYGDFDGDGVRDLLSVSTTDGVLRVFKGLAVPKIDSRDPHFGEGTRAFKSRLPAAQAITTADVDGDGDLDAFLSQYRPPFEGGEMPEPFFDANDGHPSYLLINDGKGRFTDGTEAAGLTTKRHRRNYAASFVDLNQDGNLDLVLNSDFAGVDAFQGNGKGQFTDQTQTWISQPRLFGMTQVLTDINRDDQIDLMAIGMASTTARRLEQMNAGVPGEQKITSQRASMGYGNRLYLSSGNKETFKMSEPKFAHDLAESGWSWGASSPDLDNNGLRDFYIANGHVSGKSASDYCSTFWRHDIYTEQRKQTGQNWKPFFAKKLKPLVNFETSWNGYEHNAAFIQKAPGSFTNLSFLLGISHEGDSRTVVSTDLDRDGDMDLIITILLPERDIAHRLIIYENTLKAGGPETNWIGINLGGPNASPENAEITLTRADGSKELAVISTGGSFSSQMPAETHFGLGKDQSVKSVHVKWPDGRTAQLENPTVNQWHRVKGE